MISPAWNSTTSPGTISVVGTVTIVLSRKTFDWMAMMDFQFFHHMAG
jgi:hypothetical protein